jgi:hypothetical protein
MMNLEIRARPLRETDCMRVTHDGDSPLMHVVSSGICGVVELRVATRSGGAASSILGLQHGFPRCASFLAHCGVR